VAGLWLTMPSYSLNAASFKFQYWQPPFSMVVAYFFPKTYNDCNRKERIIMSNLTIATIQEDPLSPEYMAGFLARLQKQVMGVETLSVDILESLAIRFLRREMQAISYPQALGAVRLENKLLGLVNDPTHGEAARFYLNPPFWLKTKVNSAKPNLM